MSESGVGTYHVGPVGMIRVAGYKVHELVYQSPATLVYLADREQDHVSVILKTSQSGAAQHAFRRYDREWATLQKFNDPSVIRAYDLVTTGVSPVLVLEYVPDAISVRAFMINSARTLTEILRVANRIAEAMKIIHSKGIIHRDINPDNILIQPKTGDVKLIDFGLSFEVRAQEQAVQSLFSLEGTLAYMSPEQTGRANRSIDYRTDFYSAGITIYEMLVGTPPFVLTDRSEIVYAHLARRPIPVCERNPNIPEVVSAIVGKLLEKAPEDRYQSAVGLRRDLDRVIEGLDSNNQLTFFPIAQRDPRRIFQVAERMVGREPAVVRLTEAFRRASDGHPQIVFVDGASGSGKTLLIQETYGAVTRQRGYFIRGKFDQYKRDIPFSALVQAFQEWVRQLLAESEESLRRWADRLRSSLGPNCSVMIDVIPELAWIVGPHPPAEAVGAVEARNRFRYTVHLFVGICARQEHPLVLFLDDLQWADAATLDLLRILASDPQGGVALLCAGAYRTNEVDDTHPLSVLLGADSSLRTPITRITLEPLAKEHICSILCDTLVCSSDECSELSDILLDKTQGNPFFVNQLLIFLYRNGDIHFDEEGERWRWNSDDIRIRSAAANVVDLLIDRLKGLTSETQRLLSVASYLGATFEGAMLALAASISPDSVNRDLGPALREGIIVRVELQFASGKETEQLERQAYQFLHDKVQQASYALIPPEQREQTHLLIAKHLLDGLNEDQIDEHLFTIVDHFLASTPTGGSAARQHRLASIYQKAGLRARRSTAYLPAIKYLEAALECMPADAWATSYAPMLEIYAALAECSYLVGDVDRSDALCRVAHERARRDMDHVQFYVTQIARYTSTNDLDKAIHASVQAVTRLGFPIHERPKFISVAWALAKTAWTLVWKSWSAIENAPTMTNTRVIAAINLFRGMIASAFVSSRLNLHKLIAFRILLLSLRHGYFAGTCSGFTAYATALGIFGFYRSARAYAELALRLHVRFPDSSVESLSQFTVGCFVFHWVTPLRELMPYFTRARVLGFESGNRLAAGYAHAVSITVRFTAGYPLAELRDELIAVKATFAAFQDNPMSSFVTTMTIAERLLVTVRNEDIKEFQTAFANHTSSLTHPVPIAFHIQYEMFMHLFIGGRSEDIHPLLERAEKSMPVLRPMLMEAVHFFYQSLLIGDAYRFASSAQKRVYRSQLRRNARKMARWSKQCPKNYIHYEYAIRAELARVSGLIDEAVSMYESAMSAADLHAYVPDAALLQERVANIYETLGRKAIAELYRKQALAKYEWWGAHRKVRLLSRERPELLEPSVKESFSAGTITGDVGSTVDVTTMVKASQALSGERDLRQLLTRVMTMVVENAGAQRGFLLLDRDGDLEIEATFTDVGVHVGDPSPLAVCPDIAHGVVQYVARTHEVVVLDDAAQESRFVSDAYLASRKPLSILCLALVHQGRLAGVLYLEHNELRGAFPVGRVTLIELLASQAAIAVENAVLYASISGLNRSLEAQVVTRTTELQRALADLWGEMDLAKKVQTILLPTDGRYGPYEVASSMRPADSVGGDYYDVLEAHGNVWVLIGDVSGHGISAGLIMMMVQTSVRSIVLSQPKLLPSQLLTHVNKAVTNNFRKINRDDYMTIQAFRFDGRNVCYAGLHQDILIYRSKSGKVMHDQELNGSWLGIVDDIENSLVDNTMTMDPGDILLLYTDGVTEARRGGKMVGVSGLQTIFEANAGPHSIGKSIVLSVMASLDDCVTDDDVTLVTVRFPPNS